MVIIIIIIKKVLIKSDTIHAKALQGHYTKVKNDVCNVDVGTVHAVRRAEVVIHRNDALNRKVFSSRRNVMSDAASWTDAGRPFQARGAATRKARSPSVERRAAGTSSVRVAAERSRRRASTFVVG